ncbi:MAG: hypothetical protein MI923_08155 [Phycisphaerales bacterium]|nr:hypothetical protein [Phycisphaerales bacterium]
MSARKSIGGFVLRMTLFYALFAAPWPGVQEAYSATYRAAASLLFASFGDGGTVRFEALSGQDGKFDTEIIFGHRRTNIEGRLPNNSRVSGYLPTIQVLALVLATPIPWSRRWKALCWGLILVNAFVALRMEIRLLFYFSAESPMHLYQLSPFWYEALGRTYEIIGYGLPMTFIAPIFIWIFVTFRREDMEHLIGSRASHAS